MAGWDWDWGGAGFLKVPSPLGGHLSPLKLLPQLPWLLSSLILLFPSTASPGFMFSH